MTPLVLHLREVAKTKRKKISSFKCASAREAIKVKIALISMNARFRVGAKTRVCVQMIMVVLPAIAKTVALKDQNFATNLNTVSMFSFKGVSINDVLFEEGMGV